MNLFILTLFINLNLIYSFKLMEYAGATLQALDPLNRLIRIRPSDLNSQCPGQNGMNGTCMFSFECIKGRGMPIGVCVSGYFVRVCCKLPSKPISTLTTTTTTPAPLTKQTSSFLLPTVNKQVTKINLMESLATEKIRQSLSTSTPVSTTNKVILSTGLSSSSINELTSSSTSISSSTQKPKINNSDTDSNTFTTTSTTTTTTTTTAANTNKPTSPKLNDQSTNSPTLIETINDFLDTSSDNSINNDFNEKTINNQTLKTTNFTNEFSSSINNSILNLSTRQQPSLATTNQIINKLTTLSTFSTIDKSDQNNKQAVNSFEKKNIPNQDSLITDNNSSLNKNTSDPKLNLASSSTTQQLTSTSTSTTTPPSTTLKYVDLLKPFNKTSSNTSPHLTESSTTEKSSNQSISSTTEISTVTNTTSHRVAIVYNPTSITTTPTTAASLISNENQTISSIESPVNIKSICGKRLNVPKGRIVGGTKSYFGEWPWMVSLRQWKKNAFLHKCGAALLNEYWAITAAHCVENIAATDLLLRLGEYDVSNEKEPFGYIERRVQIIASHPQFNPRTFEYDLALLRFYEKVPFRKNIIPVCLPEGNSSYVNKWATVTGWGRLYEDGPLPDLIQHVKMPIITNKECEQMYNQAGYIEDIPYIFICAGLAKGGRDSCEGDSGGPLVLEENGRWNLVGIISWGIGCGVALQPGVYTRITEFTDWIHQLVVY